MLIIVILTSNQEIGDDATEFFKNLALANLQGHYNKFLVAPTSLRSGIMNLIDKEIAKAKNNQPAEILMKMNSFTDRRIIDKIAKASKAGVTVKMIIVEFAVLFRGLKIKQTILKFVESLADIWNTPESMLLVLMKTGFYIFQVQI